MPDLFFKRSLRIHEDIGVTKWHECYRIVDPKDDRQLAVATEETDLWVSAQKLFLDKSLVPVTIRVTDTKGQTLMTLKQTRSLLRNHFSVFHGDGNVLAHFQENLCLIHPRIYVTDAHGQSMGHIAGNWRKRSFAYLDCSGNEVGRIQNLYNGLAREIFTTADDYQIDVIGDISWNPYLIAAALAIDISYHE